MNVDLQAIAHAYASDAEEYASKFGDELRTNDRDRSDLDEVAAELPAEAVVLDIGCGPAQISAYVRERGRLAVSVDLTLEMLHVARDCGAAGLAVCADVRRLPLADACADAAVCWYSLHNMPRATMPSVLAELRRVVRRDGRLLVATHAGTGEEGHDTEWHGQHERVVVTYYSGDELADILADVGFCDVRVRTRSPMPHEHQVNKLYVAATAE